MSYTTPTIAASGGTFAQLQAGGLSGQVERIIAANGFSGRAVSLIRSGESGQFQRLYGAAAEAVSNYVRGVPMTTADANALLLDLATALKALLAATEEVATLVAANPGTIRQAITNPNHPTIKRTFP